MSSAMMAARRPSLYVPCHCTPIVTGDDIPPSDSRGVQFKSFGTPGTIDDSARGLYFPSSMSNMSNQRCNKMPCLVT